MLEDSGPVFLARIESRLGIRAHIAELPEPLAPDKLTDPALNSVAVRRPCTRWRTPSAARPSGSSPHSNGRRRDDGGCSKR